MTSPLLEVEDLTIRYEADNGLVTAVTNANFRVNEGEFVGLVGESGSGKSTLANAIIGSLDSNGRIDGGTIRYKGDPVPHLTERAGSKKLGWDEVAYIPQGSMNSLDPLERISDQAYRIAKTHTNLTKKEAHSKFRDMFELMGLSTERITEYPHQFSGGMQQRAIIALALFLEPSLIIADEPTTALDVIMQDQIFGYLDRLKNELDTGMVLITHDISVVFEQCEKMSVMHSGQICETGTTKEIYDDPRHPYTLLLQEAFPDIEHPNRRLPTIEGHPPLVTGEVDYCTFVDRCPWAEDECGMKAPPLESISAPPNQGDDLGHVASCFRKDEVHELYESQGQGTTTGVHTEEEAGDD